MSEPATPTTESGERSLYQILCARPELGIFILWASLLTLCYSQVCFALPLQLKETFSADLGAKLYGILMSANGIFVLVLTPPLLRLATRWRALNCLSFSGLCYLIGFGSLAFNLSSLPTLFLSTLLWTIGEIFAVTYGSTFIADQAPVSHRGRLLSLIPLSSSLSMSASPSLVGFCLTYLSFSHLWLGVGLISLCAAIGFLQLNRYAEVEVHQGLATPIVEPPGGQ